MVLKKITVPLYRDYEVTTAVREVGIRSGYRPECSSALQCVASLFRNTNDTANFWTHFLPSVYFTFHLLSSFRLTAFSHDGTDSSHWPYLGYLLTVTAYLWASCGAHAFCSLSLRARNICYFVDYLALSVFSFGSAMLYMSYSFPQHFHNTRYEAVYLPVAAVLSMACIVMACLSRSFAGLWSQKCLRILSFVLPYMWDNLPLVYRVSSEGLRSSTAGSLYLGQFLAMMLATFFYGTHIPERLAPGKFDCLGELSVSPGTYKDVLKVTLTTFCTCWGPWLQSYKGGSGFADMTTRQGVYVPRLSGVTSLVAIISIALTNTAIMAAFIVHLPQDKTTRSH
uniref:Uncharacterized protein n=1 Tax=Timema genevievae TaxID=629358 RepID=A0A7R9PNZ7_TIMGE|nr:unnamed protein product [Timema genevievae]